MTLHLESTPNICALTTYLSSLLELVLSLLLLIWDWRGLKNDEADAIPSVLLSSIRVPLPRTYSKAEPKRKNHAIIALAMRRWAYFSVQSSDTILGKDMLSFPN